MRFETPVADLDAALDFVARGVNKTAKSLGVALIHADNDAVTLSTHARDFCHTARVSARVLEAGVIAVPVARLGALVRAMPDETTVTIARNGAAASVATARSSYRLAVLPAGDFPALLAPSAGAMAVELTRDDVDLLLAAAAEVASDDRSCFHLCGTRLYAADAKLAAVATGGRALVRRISSIAAPGWPAITIPTATVTMIERLARQEKNVVLRSTRSCSRLVPAPALWLAN
jgi:DNA polymerase III subunit beta